jgi:hypothetical protein
MCQHSSKRNAPLPYSEWMLLEKNPGLTGDLDPVCDELSILVRGFVDCGGDNPQIVCKCCGCCDPTDSTDCNLNGSDFLAQYDPHWWSEYHREGYYDFLHYSITDEDDD